MALPNLLDIAKASGSDALAGLIDESVKIHPEMTVVPARTIKGIGYKTLVRTALGQTTGGFRSANAGVTAVKNRYENRNVECFIMEPRWECDKAVADAYEDGAQAYIALEGGGILEGEMQGVCKQFFYGTNATYGNALGFPGLLQAYDATNMVKDATGTTDSTCSSVWFVRAGVKDVIWVWGQDGKLELSPVRIESLVDTADSTKRFTGYVQTLLARPGLQVGSTRSIARIKKLTADSGKGLTDALISDALGLFPAGLGPNHCFMTQRSLVQLQKSRTATTAKGGSAEFPQNLMGVDGQLIPIHVTDALSNVETLAL